MYNVNQHWDPLETCVVGRSYPPEFYSWIKKPHVRSLMERIAIETEEDYLKIISTLEGFGVKILRPDLPENPLRPDGTYMPPPMAPRDHMVMIGNKFYENISFSWLKFWRDVKDPQWPHYPTVENFMLDAPADMIREVLIEHKMIYWKENLNKPYQKIFEHIQQQGNEILSHVGTPEIINGAMISRIGYDLFFGSEHYQQDLKQLKDDLVKLFPDHRCHVVNTGGHSDGTFCPVTPGLIISLYDVPTYTDTFPDWEVVYLPGQSWNSIKPFLDLKQKNAGKYWIPGFEYDQTVIDFLDQHLRHWMGYVEETVFDVNMLIVDPKNVLVFNYNEIVFRALERYGITAHVVPFRHRYFWDGGIHCITTDLSRRGQQQDYFKDQNDW